MQLHTACLVFLPPVWSEIRWWAPRAPPKPATNVRVDEEVRRAATESVTFPVYIVWFTVPMVLWMSFIVFG
jgi:hypothetical protein